MSTVTSTMCRLPRIPEWKAGALRRIRPCAAPDLACPEVASLAGGVGAPSSHATLVTCRRATPTRGVAIHGCWAICCSRVLLRRGCCQHTRRVSVLIFQDVTRKLPEQRSGQVCLDPSAKRLRQPQTRQAGHPFDGPPTPACQASLESPAACGWHCPAARRETAQH